MVHTERGRGIPRIFGMPCPVGLMKSVYARKTTVLKMEWQTIGGCFIMAAVKRNLRMQVIFGMKGNHTMAEDQYHDAIVV